jgi:hypothetical protein
MTFDRRRSELEARSLRRLDLPRVYHENQIAELDAHNSAAQGDIEASNKLAQIQIP